MFTSLLYVGPGLGMGTIILVLIILLVILLSLGMILWIPIKNAFKKIKEISS